MKRDSGFLEMEGTGQLYEQHVVGTLTKEVNIKRLKWKMNIWAILPIIFYLCPISIWGLLDLFTQGTSFQIPQIPPSPAGIPLESNGQCARPSSGLNPCFHQRCFLLDCLDGFCLKKVSSAFKKKCLKQLYQITCIAWLVMDPQKVSVGLG